jgi:putative oxidoreductase
MDQVVTPPSGQSAASSLTATLDGLAPYALSILRIMAALLFLQHGLSKFFGFPQAMEPFPVFSMGWFAALIELAGGIVVTLGLFTRAAALIMSGEMAIGYFLFHAPQGFYPILNHGDAAILYCFVFLYLVFAGAGPWSLDALLWKRSWDGRSQRVRPEVAGPMTSSAIPIVNLIGCMMGFASAQPIPRGTVVI